MNLFFSSLGLTVWLWIDHIISWTSIHITQGSYKFIIRPPPCQSRTDPTLNKAYALLWHFSITLLIYFSSLKVLLPPTQTFFGEDFSLFFPYIFIPSLSSFLSWLLSFPLSFKRAPFWRNAWLVSLFFKNSCKSVFSDLFLQLLNPREFVSLGEWFLTESPLLMLSVFFGIWQRGPTVWALANSFSQIPTKQVYAFHKRI